jgi:hypothetical protein
MYFLPRFVSRMNAMKRAQIHQKQGTVHFENILFPLNWMTFLSFLSHLSCSEWKTTKS